MPHSNFNSDCTTIINCTDFNEIIKIFGLSNNYTNREVRIAFRKLSLKFHPDKHPEATSLATQVMVALIKAKNSLLTNEPITSHNSSQNLSDLDITRLLDEIEKHSNTQNKFLFSLIEEFNRRLQINPSYLDAMSSSYKIPLRLAIELSNVSMFKTLYTQGKYCLFQHNDFCMSPIHFLIEEIHRKTNEIETKNLEQMLVFVELDTPKKIEAYYLKTIAHNDSPRILEYCLSYLKTRNVVVSTTPENNPFIINTSLCDHYSEEDRLAFFKKHILSYPSLYDLLPNKNCTDPFMILARFCYLKNLGPVASKSFLYLLKARKVSPYFLRALLESFPELKAWEQKTTQIGSPPIIEDSFLNFIATNKKVHNANIACIVIASGMLALSLAFTTPATPAILLAFLLCVEAYILYNMARTYIESHKINTLLTNNNFFQRKEPKNIEIDSLEFEDSIELELN